MRSLIALAAALALAGCAPYTLAWKAKQAAAKVVDVLPIGVEAEALSKADRLAHKAAKALERARDARAEADSRDRDRCIREGWEAGMSDDALARLVGWCAELHPAEVDEV